LGVMAEVCTAWLTTWACPGGITPNSAMATHKTKPFTTIFDFRLVFMVLVGI